MAGLIDDEARWAGGDTTLVQLGDVLDRGDSERECWDLLLQLNTRYLLVGTCDSQCSGLAKFLPEKVIYAFEHPTHRQVEMHMAYKDMVGVRMQPASAPPLSRGGRRSGGGGAQLELRFRIGGPLSYFTREYDPANPSHDLRIGFLQEEDAVSFRERVLPSVLERCRAG